MPPLLDLPDHVLSRIMREYKSEFIWRAGSNDSWFYTQKACPIKYYSLCGRLRQLALENICSNSYIVCSSNYGRPEFTSASGMSVHGTVLSNNAKYTKRVYLDVSYEYILKGTATEILSSIGCKDSAFTNVNTIMVDISVGDTYDLPDDTTCTDHVNSFINALNRLFPNAKECQLNSTNTIEMFDQVTSNYYDTIVAGIFKQKSKIICGVSNEIFSFRTLPAIPTLTHLHITNDSGIMQLVQLARQSCLTLKALSFSIVDSMYFEQAVKAYSTEIQYPCLTHLTLANCPRLIFSVLLARSVFSLTTTDLFPSLVNLYLAGEPLLYTASILSANHKQLQILRLHVTGSMMLALAESKIFVKNGLPRAKAILLNVDINDIKDNAEQCRFVYGNILCMAPLVEMLAIVMCTPLELPVLQSALMSMPCLPNLIDLSIGSAPLSMTQLITVLKQTPCLTSISFPPCTYIDDSAGLHLHEVIDSKFVNKFCESNGNVAFNLKFASLCFSFTSEISSVPHYALLLALICPKFLNVCYSVPFIQFDKSCSVLIDSPTYKPFKDNFKYVCWHNGQFDNWRY